MKTEEISAQVYFDSKIHRDMNNVGRSRVVSMLEDYASIKTKELQEVFTLFKEGIAKGSELYANLRFDDQEFTPYQIALQKIQELTEENEKLKQSIITDEEKKEAIEEYKNLESQLQQTQEELKEAKEALIKVRDFDEDSEYDDPGQIANESIKRIESFLKGNE
jgi:hypothetical protein